MLIIFTQFVCRIGRRESHLSPTSLSFRVLIVTVDFSPQRKKKKKKWKRKSEKKIIHSEQRKYPHINKNRKTKIEKGRKASFLFLSLYFVTSVRSDISLSKRNIFVLYSKFRQETFLRILTFSSLSLKEDN